MWYENNDGATVCMNGVCGVGWRRPWKHLQLFWQSRQV